MGYKVPDWKKSIKQNLYEIETDDGVFYLPKVEYLSGDQAIAMSQAQESEERTYEVLDELAPGLGAAFRPVPVKYLKEMIEDWQADSGVGLGESEASSD